MSDELNPSQYEKFGRDLRRFDYRKFGDAFQVYASELEHICICDTEEKAQMVTESLNIMGEIYETSN